MKTVKKVNVAKKNLQVKKNPKFNPKSQLPMKGKNSQIKMKKWHSKNLPLISDLTLDKLNMKRS